MAIDFLAHLQANSERFEQVLADSDPAAPVPTCAGWTAADLLWHLGEVQHSWGTIVHDRLTEWEQYQQPARPDSYEGLLWFFHDASHLLIDALATTSDDVPVWS